MTNYGYIYALREPDSGKVRYIGMAVDPESRYQVHLKRAPGETYHKARWINKLLTEGKIPSLVVLCKCDIDNAPTMERAIIQRARECGYDLTNCTDGGLGSLNPSDETRERMAAAKRGKPGGRLGVPCSEGTKRKISKTKKGKPAWNKARPASGATKKKQSKSAKRRASTLEGQAHVRAAGLKGAQARWNKKTKGV